MEVIINEITEPICKNCKFWKRGNVSGWDLGVWRHDLWSAEGICEMSGQVQPRENNRVNSGDLDLIETGENFGCIHFIKKED